MAILKCKMCGGQLTFEEGATVCECEYCGSKQTIPAVDDEKKIKLFDRANRLRINGEFDKASSIYESIVAEFDEEAEGYWGLLLCKYGIEYVDDPATGDKIPTCHRSSFESIMKDPDFEMVMENADSIARSVYREQAKQIEEIRKGIVEISGKEAPYDIFICYKETAEDGQRTIDSVLAQDVYDALTAKGYRVFFSRITLEDKLGTEYEPYIFAALNSAKVMLAFGTSYDYYNAVWVKNEWSRYLKLMAKDKEKHLIPCYKNIDAYDIPEEFTRLQAQDMGKVGAIQDLIRGIDKLLGGKESSSAQAQTIVVQQSGGPNVNALIQRGYNALEDEDFDAANDFFNRVLDSDATCAEGYLGLFMVDISAWNKSEVERLFKASALGTFNGNKNYQRAKKYAGESLMAEFTAWEKMSAEEEAKRVEKARIKKEKQLAAEKAAREEQLARKKAAREKLLAREKVARENQLAAQKAAEEANEKRRAELEVLLKEYESFATEEYVYSDEERVLMDKLKNAEDEINDKEKYLYSLGLFKVKEKSVAKEQIDTLKDNKRSIEKKLSTLRAARKAELANKLELNGMSIFKDVKPRDYLLFGSYKEEHGIVPITWIVLDVQGNRRLLLSKYALESIPYNETNVKDITWSKCTLRKFLNGDFLQNAFSESEQKYIESSKLSTPNNVKFKTSGGSDTTDKIFCLSIGDTTKYFKSNESGTCKPTPYARSNGAFIDGATGNCEWVLRSPGMDSDMVAYVNHNGSVLESGSRVSRKYAIRPALWINLAP